MDNLLNLIDKRIEKYFKQAKIPKEIPAVVVSYDSRDPYNSNQEVKAGYARVRFLNDFQDNTQSVDNYIYSSRVCTGKEMCLLNKTGEALDRGDYVWVTYTGLLTADNAYISRRNGVSYISSNITSVDVIGAINYSSIYLRQTSSDMGKLLSVTENNISCYNSAILCQGLEFKNITSGDITQSILGGHVQFEGINGTESSCISSLLIGAYNTFQEAYQSIGFGIDNTYHMLQTGTIAGGSDNYVYNGMQSVISGTSNNYDSVNTSVVTGNSNTGGYIGQSMICGGNNSMPNGISSSLVCGNNNKINSVISNSVVLGNSVNIPDNYYQIGGAYSEISSGSLIIGGGYTGDIGGYSNAVIATGQGNIYVSGNYNTNGADYAEIFEWVDGNPNNEDRRGLFVVLNHNKIRLANRLDDREDILGVISAFPSVVGDMYETEWHGKYETDVFGHPILIECEETIEENGETKTIKVLKKKISKDYDSSKDYIPRSQRPEYSYVGTMGKLVVVDDGSCEENGWCYPNINGVATKCIDKSKGYKVMERIDKTHIRIWVK